MKKIFAFIVLSIFTLPFLAAQENLFVVGDKVINLGIGIGNVMYSGLGYTSSIPPLSISFEKGIKDGILDKGVLGVGGYLGYSANKWESSAFGSTWGWKYSNLILGARGVFHYPLLDKIDTYAGLLLGYKIVTVKEIGTVTGMNPASVSGLILSGYVGGRYYFNEKFAGMAELGYGITWLNIGLAIKL